MRRLLDFVNESTCYSPFSLMHAMLVLSFCADDEAVREMVNKLGIQRDEMLRLQQQLASDESIALAANIFAKDIGAVNESFSKQMMEVFGFTPEKLRSAKQVNDWCAKHTKGRITEIVNDVDFEAILLSAIHFKADWVIPFNKDFTEEKDFHGFDGTTKR